MLKKEVIFIIENVRCVAMKSNETQWSIRHSRNTPSAYLKQGIMDARQERQAVLCVCVCGMFMHGVCTWNVFVYVCVHLCVCVCVCDINAFV